MSVLSCIWCRLNRPSAVFQKLHIPFRVFYFVSFALNADLPQPLNAIRELLFQARHLDNSSTAQQHGERLSYTYIYIAFTQSTWFPYLNVIFTRHRLVYTCMNVLGTSTT